MKVDLRASEFWVGLGAAVTAYLVQQGVLSQEAAQYAHMALVYVVGRIVSKVAKSVPTLPKPR